MVVGEDDATGSATWINVLDRYRIGALHRYARDNPRHAPTSAAPSPEPLHNALKLYMHRPQIRPTLSFPASRITSSPASCHP